MRYIEPEMIALVLGNLIHKNEEKYKEVVATLHSLHNSDFAPDVKHHLLNVLRKKMIGLEEDETLPYLSFYRDIVVHADESIASDIMGGLVANKRILKFVEGSVIRYERLFEESDGVVAEVLADVTYKELAYILMFADDTQKSRIYEGMDRRKKDIMQEEVEYLGDPESPENLKSFDSVRKSVEEKLRDLGKQGKLSKSDDDQGDESDMDQNVLQGKAV